MGPNNDLPIANECACGAVTVSGLDLGGNRFDISMPKIQWEKDFPQIVLSDKKWYTCNYCVSGYGTDLCGCGSKEKVGECENDYPECHAKTPSQYAPEGFLLPHNYMVLEIEEY